MSVILCMGWDFANGPYDHEKFNELAAKLEIPVRREDFYSYFNLTAPNKDDDRLNGAAA